MRSVDVVDPRPIAYNDGLPFNRRSPKDRAGETFRSVDE
jgi:hypothetical protein